MRRPVASERRCTTRAAGAVQTGEKAYKTMEGEMAYNVPLLFALHQDG